METPENKISPEQARALLWHQGIVHWLLKPVQKDLYDSYLNCKEKIVVWNCARRLGKSYALCVIAIEVCLKAPNSLVKYCCAKQKDAKGIIRPLIREIIESCPPELKPEFKTQEGAWVFPNGSRIELVGLDGGRAESVRGGSAHLGIIDEAGLVSDLPYIITSIILPTTATTKGKIILASTPPKSPNHPFITRYLNKAQIEGNLITKTIYDNPNIDKEEFDICVRESGGLDSIDFRREYGCVDENTLIKTKSGYKKIKEIIAGEEVFTHKGRYRKVLNVFKNDLDNRKVFNIKSSNNMGHIVTEDHRLLVTTTDYRRDVVFSSTSWTEAAKISPRPSEKPYFYVPVEDRQSDFSNVDKAYLAGWYVAEGSCNKSQQQVSFALSKRDPIEEIQLASQKVFNKQFVPYSEKYDCISWTINLKEAKAYFKQFGTHSTKKRVIDEIKYGTSEVKRSFLKAYIKGDGWDSGKHITIVSVCLELLADISDMLFSLGVGNQIQQNRKAGPSKILGRDVNIHDTYVLLIGGKNYDKYHAKEELRRSVDFIKDNVFYSRIKKIEEVKNYNKTHVYDIEVEEDHSYVGLHGTFHNCEIIKDENYAIVPEFNRELKEKVVKEWPRATFYDAYLGMDIGMKDLTVVLFAWYDFSKAKLIVEDEYVVNGQKFNTSILAEGIKKKEAENFTDKLTGEQRTPYLRVSDNNLIVIKDLYDLHGLRFIPTRKDDADAALNKVRIMLQNEEIIINPRCITLITHLESGIYNKSKTSFERSADNGHFDAIDSLKYLVRNVQKQKNPYPKNYMDKRTWEQEFYGQQSEHKQATEFNKIFNINKTEFDRNKELIDILTPKKKTLL